MRLFSTAEKFKKLSPILFVVFFVLGVLFSASVVDAATLSIVPGTSTVTVGNIITLNVVVNSAGQSINNSDATIQFPADLLQVISISKSSSIFSLWVQDPSFSNATGQISFNGGITNPGYTGSNGELVSITFQTKKAGVASVLFSDAAVRANDGLGTDVLTAKNGGTLNINALVATPTPQPPAPSPTKPTLQAKSNDTTPPEPFTPTARVYDNQNIVKLNATDSGSGIGYYTIQIDDTPILTVQNDELVNSEYTLPYLQPGSHNLVIVAYDKAGNQREASLTIVSPFISAPIISLSANQITKGEVVVISGTSDYDKKQVLVTLESAGQEVAKYTQAINSDGSFSVTTDNIQTVGQISISAENILSDKVKSQPSENVYLTVNETQFVKMTTVIMGLIFIAVLLMLLLAALYIGWHKFFGLKKQIRKELEDTVAEVHKAALLLKEELDNQLKALEKIKTDRILTTKEEAIFVELQKNVDDVEIFIDKKLKKLM
jgi:hypothetical protein